MKRSRRREASGFSLIELLIGLAIAAIVLAIAVPSFRNFIYNSRRAGAVNELQGAFQFARSEALKSNGMVTVCASTNGTSCSATVTDWKSGWLMFVKAPGNTTPCTVESAGTGDTILKYTANDNEGITIKATQSCYTFRSFGVSNTCPSGTCTVTFCDPRATDDISFARAIVVAGTGRTRLSTTDAAGSALTCP